MIFGDMYKIYDRTIKICKNMTTEACVHTVNRFDPYFRRIHIFVYWSLLNVFLFLLYFQYFDFFFHSKLVFSVKFCEFCVFPELWNFSVLRIAENWGLSSNHGRVHAITILRSLTCGLKLWIDILSHPGGTRAGWETTLHVVAAILRTPRDSR